MPGARASNVNEAVTVLSWLEAHNTMKPHLKAAAIKDDLVVFGGMPLETVVGKRCRKLIDAMASFMVLADPDAYLPATKAVMHACRIEITG